MAAGRIGKLVTAMRKAAKGLGALIVLVIAISVGTSIWGVARTSMERPSSANVVNDVTQLNPIAVAKIIAPTTTEEIVTAIRAHKGPISIGGGRYSMGGQTATEQSLHIDMRRFNRILDFSRQARTITVQAGIRWRQIQEHIDRHDLSIKIMQTYANFTVGGSLSVNVHGRYVGLGPLIYSVKSLKVVLADGTLVEASPALRPEIFYGVIGGYGGLGVITEATLELADNVKVERQAETMAVSKYRDYFFRNIRESKSAIFHNADIYPDEYRTVHVVSYVRTDKPVTIEDRLVPGERSYRLERFAFWVMSEWPFGKDIREYIIDPLLFRGREVVWRNYEASYDVAELEPASREHSTYVLQEYFIPVERFDEFVPKMRDVLGRHGVNVINISIRHAFKDPGSLLAWAGSEVFAFVLYYQQGTDAAARTKVGTWTRELIDAALSVGGSYYLPYQPHATDEQFLRAYPRAQEFFSLKKRLDPQNKFRNKLWDKYYGPRADALPVAVPPALRERLAARKGYLRDEGQTYLTHPEWYIVYSSDEYAEYLKERLPTEFPYVASIGQYWVNYWEVTRLTSREYPANWGYQFMLWVIGTSYSVELTLKALYENTIGRLTGWLAGGELTDEDRYAYRVAKDYADFIHMRPWYEYDFWSRFSGLWKETRLWGDHVIRKWERKLILSVEYSMKSAYGWLIRVGTGTLYDPEDDKMQMVVAGLTGKALEGEKRLAILEVLDGTHTLVAAPRYDGFRDMLLKLALSRPALGILEIAGNDEILVTGIAPRDWRYTDTLGTVLYTLPVPTDESKKRIAMRVPTRHLLAVLRDIQERGGVKIDHIYDY